MPKLIIYCDDINKHAKIPLTNLKISQLLKSNFLKIDNYVFDKLIKCLKLINYLILKSHKNSFQFNTTWYINKKEKIIKKIVYYHESLYQISFIPPSIVVSNNIKQIGQYHLSIADIKTKILLTTSLKIKLNSSQLSPTWASVKVNITDQQDFIAAQQGLACSENGFLLNQNIETGFKIVCTPASLEFYHPTTLEKQIRIIEENELQQIIDLNFILHYELYTFCIINKSQKVYFFNIRLTSLLQQHYLLLFHKTRNLQYFQIFQTQFDLSQFLI
ncbi:unnamed protein product [Paramecium primaurelia]|uniref:Uncharacterized protein n=1 Tax=Paramecium primaurelia TaxID=5886 RepID=A0A8S1Q845_PARPR|nr:unnamed protein product [Paramecium primaurelia]